MLYVEGPMGSGKTSRLLAETSRLLDAYPASSVLVLCSNHSRQQTFIAKLLTRRTDALAQLPVYTYAGFVRNALFNYWPLVEQDIVSVLKRGAPFIRPELSGLEDSELMLKWLLARLRQEAASKGQAVFDNFPGTDQHILKQVVRRLRLRSENQLTRPDMTQRSELLEEMCRTETAWLEKHFDIESYTLRVLDTNKQLDIFNNLMRKDTALSQWLQQGIKHLVVDDVDETIVAEQRLIEFLAPTLDTLILAADVDGGSRRGYLNAYPYDWEALKRLCPGETVTLTRQDASFQAAQSLLANWKTQQDFQPLPGMVQVFDSFMTRVEMLEQVLEDILALVESGYSPGDIALVLPRTDFLSFHQLQTRLHQRGIPVQLLSGTSRPSDNPKCKAFITLIQWANCRRWGTMPSRWEVKTLFMQILQFHYLPECTEASLDALSKALFDGFSAESIATALLPPLELLPVELGLEAQSRYRILADWLHKADALPFDQQLYSAFKELLALFASERDTFADLNRIIQSYLRQRAIHQGLVANVGEVDGLPVGTAFDRWWLEQVKSGTMADTPEVPEAVSPEAVIIATPQKIIDAEVYRKVQFWLDVGAREWARSDNAPLYNAWVHSAVWDGSSTAFTEEFNEAVIRTRAGHITRTLMLLATEQVRAYASELDDLGFTQAGLLKPRLLNEPEAICNTPVERAVLRADQVPVLNYRAGTMAISAVPGAGKTFVNVELLLELISQGVAADRILVLTYMDSAAKTLLSRLKQKLTGVSNALPVVSTIHSLAFRILTENDHAVLAGFLPDDMTILDDYSRADVLARVAAATQPESSKNVGDWQRAIDRGVNHVKMFDVSEVAIRQQLQHMPGNFRLAEFVPALALYNQELQRQGALDFTDLIIKAVELLRKYPDIRAKYQAQFAYIIEDEAQDSSRLLQEFIQLLGGPQPNLIRTGDTNQSITTTFSSAEPSVFREFIKSADTAVHMDCSGRCATDIIALANRWIVEASQLPGLEQAFEPVVMQPVSGQNPTILHAPHAQVFEMDRMEESWLVERIQAIREAQPGASIAVLMRNNTQVNRLTGLLHQAKIPAVSLSEQLNVSPVFLLMLTTLQLLATPNDLALQSRWHKLLVDAQIIPEQAERKAFLDEKPLVYQSPLDLQDEFLRQWYYDFLDFGRQAAGGNISVLIARMSERFCLSVQDRSNGYLCALMAQEILNTFQHLVHLSPLEIVIHQFEAFQRSWRGKKSFGDVLATQGSQVVQVMTMHKSKGQEFDVVFMPFLQADYFPHEAEKLRFDESDKLIQELDLIAANTAGKPFPENYPDLKKREKIEEEARLIYVGLTRAKRALYLTAHSQSMTRYNRLRNVEPAKAFQVLERCVQPENQPVSLHRDNIIPLKEEPSNAQAP